MEGAGFLEAGAQGDFADAQAVVVQVFEGDGAAGFVLEFLEAETLALQLAAEGGGSHAVFLCQ
ncbi:hypothetical protein D3C81_1998600 [compost metagenome]